MPEFVTTTTNTAFIHFDTVSLETGKGFEIEYISGCKFELDGSAGIILSPGVIHNPDSSAVVVDKMPNLVTCEYKITATGPVLFDITGALFLYKKGSTDDSLTVYNNFEKKKDENKKFIQVRGEVEKGNLKYHSDEKKLLVQFLTDFGEDNEPKPGFKATWSIGKI